MIIGSGLLGTELRKVDREGIIFFASGVSDSKCVDQSQYDRELNLLKNYCDTDSLFVYFSTTSIENPEMKQTQYVQFKLEIEDYIKKNTKNFLIVRASNIVGFGGNSKTVVNFFYNNIKKKLRFPVWANSYRNILDVEVLVKMVDYYIAHFPLNQTINLSNLEDTNVMEIIRSFEEILDIKALFESVDKGDSFNFDKITSIEIITALELEKEILIETVLRKYYAKRS